MKQIQFDIDRAPESLNKILRINWRQRNEYQGMMDGLIHAIWLQKGRPIFMGLVKIKYTISFPENRRRDIDNYIGGTKYFTDALKRTFLLRDDAEVLKSVSVEFATGKEKTTILIEEV